ncbi:Alpha carbonic anhydrase [Corchorus capsularis]|uniref:Alpha carbonic anhydrase n=1 Tax=Corchorus capsularis TaxID=210143 RepID=A0A1R3KAU1_COCAP|nr:Alpha carbonic anhydrase [Corchorus capsularis]
MGTGDSFNYDESSGRGPSHWGTLKPEWRQCSAGRRQSPIDIGRVQIRSNLGDLQKNYSAASAALVNGTFIVEVLWQGKAGKIQINRTEYGVVNVHWHSPSEHTFNGTRYDLELHLVHKSGQNNFAVVSMLYQIGLPDPFLAKLLPSIRGLGGGSKNETEVGSMNPESIGILSGRKYYRYVGSLTAPPCTEGVIWTIFHQARTVSRQQVEALKEVLPIVDKNNSRPTQALNGRQVFVYHPWGNFTNEKS